MSVILATREAEIRRTAVRGQVRKKFKRPPPISTNKKK
jgi:hypothetical protein